MFYLNPGLHSPGRIALTWESKHTKSLKNNKCKQFSLSLANNSSSSAGKNAVQIVVLSLWRGHRWQKKPSPAYWILYYSYPPSREKKKKQERMGKVGSIWEQKCVLWFFKGVATFEKKSCFGIIQCFSEPASHSFVSSKPVQDRVLGSTRCWNDDCLHRIGYKWGHTSRSLLQIF